MVLPLAAGPAVADALDGWSAAPRALASVMSWAAWAVVLAGTLAPRPAGLTALRVTAPLAVLVAAAASASASALDATGALAATAFATAVAATPEVAAYYANGVAFGAERRFPLRTPPGVLWVATPLAVVAFGAGLVSGPLLLADARWVAGTAASTVGLPLAAFALRSLHALSMRWAILVPGGLLAHDPLALTDPVLLPRDRIASLRPGGDPCEPGALDLRMGARGGTVAVDLHRPVEMPVRRGRRKGEIVSTAGVLLSVARPGALLAAAARRHLPVA